MGMSYSCDDDLSLYSLCGDKIHRNDKHFSLVDDADKSDNANKLGTYTAEEIHNLAIVPYTKFDADHVQEVIIDQIYLDYANQWKKKNLNNRQNVSGTSEYSNATKFSEFNGMQWVGYENQIYASSSSVSLSQIHRQATIITSAFFDKEIDYEEEARKLNITYQERLNKESKKFGKLTCNFDDSKLDSKYNDNITNTIYTFIKLLNKIDTCFAKFGFHCNFGRVLGNNKSLKKYHIEIDKTREDIQAIVYFHRLLILNYMKFNEESISEVLERRLSRTGLELGSLGDYTLIKSDSKNFIYHKEFHKFFNILNQFVEMIPQLHPYVIDNSIDQESPVK